MLLELLLVKMMRYVAQQCPDDEYNFMVRRLRLNQEEINDVNDDQMLTKQEKLLKLFAHWRKRSVFVHSSLK